MTKLLQLVKFDFLLQNRINNITQYLTTFFIFLICTNGFIIAQFDILNLSIIFLLIIVPISLINITELIFYSDIQDGHLEYLLSTFTATEIVVSKFLCILFIATFSALINIILIYFIFNISYNNIILTMITLLLIIVFSSGLVVLISSMRSYYRSGNKILTTIIMPLLIPHIIFSSIILQNYNNTTYYIMILLLINIILLPIILYLATYLINNIYNF